MPDKPKPPVELHGYQKRWINDSARFKGAVKSVQIGWSFASALEVALDMIAARQTWLWMSGSQRQSKEAAQYTKRHLTAMGAVADLDENVEEFFGKTRTMVDRVVMPNGSRAFFLPANADTARGFAGNVVLDEFASHDNAKAIWAAMFGRVSRGFRLRVFSSPKGAVGKFWELAKQWGLAEGIAPQSQPVQAGPWSAHWCDVHQAIADGAPLDAGELRAAMRDDDLFSQEYLCQFLDAEKQFIPTELIEAAVSARAGLALAPGFRPAGELWMGTDQGRMRDLTAHVVVEELNGQWVVRAVDIQRRAKFSAQKRRFVELLGAGVRRAAIDAGGIGMQNAEELAGQFPGRVEAVDFAKGQVKPEIAVRLLRRFEDRQIEIPDDPDLKADLKAVKRIVTAAGNIRYDAARTKDGHADRFWALGLALHAADAPCQPVSGGVLAGRGVITGAEIDGLAYTAPKGDWWHPATTAAEQRTGGQF